MSRRDPGAPSPARAWEHDEEGLEDVRRDLRTLLDGSRRRWVWTLLLSLGITLVAVGLKARKDPKHTVDIVIRMTEKKFDDETRPPSTRDIRRHLYDVALSRTALLALIKEYDLYPDKMFDPVWAVEAMKEDIEIFVLSNYFSPETYIENPLRELRLVVSYAHVDPEKALTTTRAMGKLIAREQTTVRRKVAMRTASAGAEAARMLQQDILLVRREIADLNRIRDKNPLALVRLRRLVVELEVLQEQAGGMTQQVTNLGLRGELEKKVGGLEFELADEGRPPRVLLDTRTRLIIIGVFLFLFCIPIVGIGVAAVDPIVYDRRQVGRLCLRYLGHLPVSGAGLGILRPGGGQADTSRGKRGKLGARRD
ncbi:MAG: hypothetical protein AAF715_06140 [Myxococcota bacterium]